MSRVRGGPGVGRFVADHLERVGTSLDLSLGLSTDQRCCREEEECEEVEHREGWLRRGMRSDEDGREGMRGIKVKRPVRRIEWVGGRCRRDGEGTHDLIRLSALQSAGSTGDMRKKWRSVVG